MKVVISGATGFIGRNLSHRLVTGGATVHAITRPGSDANVLPKEVVVHRLVDGTGLPELFGRICPDTAFHLATYYAHDTAVDRISTLFDTNLTFATQFANAAATSGCQSLVNTGTASQLDLQGNYAPASLYAASKQAFEDILKYYHQRRQLPCATMLIFDTYGHNDPRNKLLMHMIAAAKEDRVMELSPGGQEIDMVHIDDAIDALLVAEGAIRSKPAQPQRYALSSGKPITIRALGDLISQINGRPFRAAWGARPYRDHEVMQTWKGGEPPPGWQPKRRLEDFLRAELAG